MNRIGIALLLAVATMGASAGHSSSQPLLMEGKGIAAVAGNTGLSEDARAQQAIDAATMGEALDVPAKSQQNMSLMSVYPV